MAVKIYAGGLCNVSGNLLPCTWLDGVRTALSIPGGASYGAVEAVFTDGVDFYACGYSVTGSVVTGHVWENEARSDLSGYKSHPKGIVVSGGSVYVSGYYVPVSDHVPCYWVDGVRTDLAVISGSTQGEGMAIDGSDMYVVGWDAYDAVFWKNSDAPIHLPRTKDWAWAYDVAVGGGHVYVVGADYGAGDSYGTPCVWVDGVELTPYVETNGSEAKRICADASGHYEVGTYDEDASGIPCRWMNTTREDLPGGTWGYGFGICVLDGIVYSSGKVYTDHEQPCTWAGTTRADLEDGGEDGAANGVIAYNEAGAVGGSWFGR